MKKFTKAALIVTAVFVLLGGILCTVGFGIGFSFSEFRSMMQDGAFQIGRNYSWGWSEHWDGFDDDSHEFLESAPDESYEFDGDEYTAIENLKLDVEYGEVDIKEGSKNEGIQVEVKYKKTNHKRQILVTREGSTLSVAESGGRHRLNNDNVRITIKIPAGKEFADVSLDNSAGSITISREITAENLNIIVDVGECDVEKKLTVSGKIYGKVGAGEIDIAETEASEMELRAGVGAIDVDRVAADDVILDCGIGSISLEVMGLETDYSYIIDCSVGEVEIGENSYTGLGSKREVKNPGTKNMDIKCNVGEINIEFIR